MTSLKNYNRLFLGLKSSQADFSKTKLIYFHGPNFADHETFEYDEFYKVIQHKHFNPLNKTVFYLHGYIEHKDIESVQVIVEAYLTRNDINLVILEWGDLAEGNYLLDAVPNCKQLGQKLTVILNKAFDDVLNIEKFHVVGHSLGGQLGGIIGRELTKITKGKKILKRITALDPAFPPFYLGFTDHICKTDAEFVDVIHTDAWLYGAPFSTGTADFWPNGGKTLQPGCPKRNYKLLTDNDLSSHRRSWWFWAESVVKTNENKFNAVRAKSWSNFRLNKIIEEPIEVYMGDDCPSSAYGDYFLQTNGIKPFARGNRGILFRSQSEIELEALHKS